MSEELAITQAERLRITEIFLSLQGESASVGWPTVFVRLTGCPLRCGYCDTAYAFQGGEWMSLDNIMERINDYHVPHITVTGGEPLAQKACLSLLTRLCDADYQVSLETSGALDIAAVDERVMKVMDIKTPGSGEMEKNRWQNLNHITSNDNIKFVICDREDYNWAKEKVVEYQLAECCEVLFSPVFGKLEPRTLADWIVEDKLLVRFQLQLHKILWGDKPGK